MCLISLISSLCRQAEASNSQQKSPQGATSCERSSCTQGGIAREDALRPATLLGSVLSLHSASGSSGGACRSCLRAPGEECNKRRHQTATEEGAKESKGGEMSGAVMDTRPSPVEPEDGGGAAKRYGGGGGGGKVNPRRHQKAREESSRSNKWRRNKRRTKRKEETCEKD